MTDVTTVEAGPRAVARRVEVPASAGDIFELLADPHRHQELDGSGTVRATVSGPDRLSEGARFSVNMRQLGIPYRITSTVVSFVEDRLVEWRHPMGHTWRWELAETAPGRTTVTETFDYSGAALGTMFELSGRTATNVRGMTATLEQLRRRFSDCSGSNGGTVPAR